MSKKLLMLCCIFLTTVFIETKAQITIDSVEQPNTNILPDLKENHFFFIIPCFRVNIEATSAEALDITTSNKGLLGTKIILYLNCYQGVSPSKQTDLVNIRQQF